MLAILKEMAQFKAEYEPNYSPSGFESNGDGSILYGMVRKWRPKRIVEIGAGSSTRVSALAMRQNELEGAPRGKILAIEPYPKAALLTLAQEDASVQLIPRPVEEIGLETFLELGVDDILFIDSSHIIKCGNDVHYLYLRILPKIQTGTLVHIHDIRFPQDYPKDWLLTKKYFWNEQYLLQMFLSFNSSFEVVFAANYMRLRYAEKMEQSLVGLGENLEGWPGSFWIRRIS